MAKYVMALDAGTTSNRCILFNEKERSSVLHRRNLHSIFHSRAGWSMMLRRSGQHSLEWQ